MSQYVTVYRMVEHNNEDADAVVALYLLIQLSQTQVSETDNCSGSETRLYEAIHRVEAHIVNLLPDKVSTCEQ